MSQDLPSRPLGASPLQVPPVVFGAWAVGGWYWGGAEDARSVAAIQASIEAGVTAIDTAPMYGMGHSERVVGQAVAGGRDRVVLMSKVGLRWDDERGAHFFETRGPDGEPVQVYRNLRPDSVTEEVHASLERMGVEHLDLVQCHWPDPTTPVEETMHALADLVEAGRVRAIGVSNFTVPLLERASAALAGRGQVLASNQPPYSLLRRGIERDVLPWCRLHEVGSLVYSPLEQGLLAGAVPPDRAFPKCDGRGRNPLFSPESRVAVLAALETLRPVARRHGCSFAQLAAAWCFHQPGVSAAIVGARSPEQAVENAEAARLQLEADELRTIASAFDGLAPGR